MSARHKLPADPGRAAQGTMEDETPANNELIESLLESEFYSRWEGRQVGESTRPGEDDIPTSPSKDSSKTPSVPLRRAHAATPNIPQLPSVRRLTPPPPIGSLGQPAIPGPSATVKDLASGRAAGVKDSGLFVREPALPRASDRSARPASGGVQRSPRAAFAPVPDPGQSAARDWHGVALERALRAQLEEALRKVSASEAGRLQAERRARAAEQRALWAEQALAAPAARYAGDEPSASRSSGHPMLWIGLATALLTLAAAAGYSTVYLPMQRRLSAQHNLLNRSFELNQREFAILRALLEEERTRSAREREQFSAHIEELLKRHAGVVAERDPKTPKTPGGATAAPELKAKRVKHGRKLRRPQAERTENPYDPAPSGEIPAKKIEDAEDLIEYLQLR